MVSIAHRPSGDLKAYDLWLLGQATFLSFDPNNWEKARGPVPRGHRPDAELRAGLFEPGAAQQLRPHC